MTNNRYGKGRVGLFPSALGALSLTFRFPDTRRLILNAARLLAGPPVSVEGGDEFIETTLRRGADGGVVVHLLNWAMGERPSSSAIPMGPLRVRVRLPPGARRPPFAHLCWAGRKVRCSSTGDGVSFVVPGITEYEMVRLPGD